MAFQLMDAVLFLNIHALLSAMIKRIKGYIKLRMALGTLHAALPDASAEELREYDNECAICRKCRMGSKWGNTSSTQGVDVPNPSTGNRPVGLSRVQMMMRNLAAMGAQMAVEDSSWGPWPFNPSEAAASGSLVPPPAAGGRFPGGLHLRTVSRADNLANLLAMAETV